MLALILFSFLLPIASVPEWSNYAIGDGNRACVWVQQLLYKKLDCSATLIRTDEVDKYSWLYIFNKLIFFSKEEHGELRRCSCNGRNGRILEFQQLPVRMILHYLPTTAFT